MSSKFLCVIIFLIINSTSFAQEDSVFVIPAEKPEKSWFKRAAKNTFNKYFNDSSSPEKPKLLIYPTLAYSPETSWEIGFSALYLYHARRDTVNRLSEIQSFNFFTLNKQYGAWFDHFLYTHRDKWFFLGRLRFQRFPLQYFGIGPHSKKEDKLLINSDYILIRERVLKRVIPNFFAGLEMDYQKLYHVQVEANGSPLAAPPGSEGTTNFGIGAGLVYDNRHNAMNVRKGLFAEFAFMKYDPSWGSDYTFNSFSFDNRIYQTVKKNQVFAAQFYGQFIQGNAPFNQLALLGNEGLMRGYYYGRYRDRQYMAAQAEYRFLPFPFSKRIGGAVFAAAGAVAPSLNAFTTRNLLPSGGLGVRYLVFPKKDIFLRFDVGFTKEGPAFYIYNGEAF